MSDAGLFVSEVLKGMSQGMMQGMEMRRQRYEFEENKDIKKRELDIREKALGIKNTKDVTFEDWKGYTPEVKAAYMEYISAKKGSKASLSDALIYMNLPADQKQAFLDGIYKTDSKKAPKDPEDIDIDRAKRRADIRKANSEAEKIEEEVRRSKELTPADKEEKLARAAELRAKAKKWGIEANQKALGEKVPQPVLKETAEAIAQIDQSKRATERVKLWMATLKKDGATKSNFFNKLKYFTKNYMGLVDNEEALAGTAFYGELNAYIKQITGAQMSEPEARRLLKAMPQLQSNPDVFMNVWNTMMRDRYEQIRSKIDTYSAQKFRNYEGYKEKVDKEKTFFDALPTNLGEAKSTQFSEENIRKAKDVAKNPAHPQYKNAINYLKSAGVIK
jgi:hypothetical protein